MSKLRNLALVAALVCASGLAVACKPAPVTCKTTMFKYDHKTTFVTWFTLYNEMRFCYDGTKATRIEWDRNRTSSPTLPYTKGAVGTSKGIETYDGSKKRARNFSTHGINCASVLSGFDISMRQLGYGTGTVTTWRGDIHNGTDC